MVRLSADLNCWSDLLRLSAVEMICWDRLWRLSVEINCWDYLLSWSVGISCCDALLNCKDYRLRSAIEIICGDQLLRLPVEICNWDYLLTSADQPINQTIKQKGKDVHHWKHKQTTTHIATDGGVFAEPSKRPLHTKSKTHKTKNAHMQQKLMACLLNQSKKHAHRIKNTKQPRETHL